MSSDQFPMTKGPSAGQPQAEHACPPRTMRMTAPVPDGTFASGLLLLRDAAQTIQRPEGYHCYVPTSDALRDDGFSGPTDT